MAPGERASSRDPELVKAVADGVAAARTRAALSRPAFAEALGWSVARLVDVELARREARVADLVQVCAVLRIGLGDLLGETEPGRRAAMALQLGRPAL